MRSLYPRYVPIFPLSGVIESERIPPVAETTRVRVPHFDIVSRSISISVIFCPFTDSRISPERIPAFDATLHERGVRVIPLCSI